MTQGHRQLQSGSDLIADMARMMAEEEEEQHVDRGFMGTVGGRGGGGGHGHGHGDRWDDDGSSSGRGDGDGDGMYRDDGDLAPNVGNTVRHLAKHRMFGDVVDDDEDGDEAMDDQFETDGQFRANKQWATTLLNNPNITGMQSRDAMLRRKEEQKDLYRRHQQMGIEEVVRMRHVAPIWK